MKKISIVLIILVCLFGFLGCGKSDLQLAKDNMSEITNIFFLAEKEGDRASISVGYRESPYKRDGIHNSVCEFSLVSVFVNGLVSMRLPAVIKVNGQAQDIVLELVGKSYMFDLEYCLKADDKVELCYNGKQLDFERQNFGIDSEKAIEIGLEDLSEKFVSYKNGKTFSAECYLKILGEVGSDFNDLFWCFTIVGENENVYNSIINVTDGSIISENTAI